VVERTALEMRHTRKGIEGSNPSLSASCTRSRPLQNSELFEVIAKFCTALQAFELELLHILLHILLHKVRQA
jgi:hypothetical protein